MIAYYSAKSNYEIFRESPTGKGFADMVYMPNNGVKARALLIELKYDMTDKTAFDQIEARNYPDGLKFYHGDLYLLAVIIREAANVINVQLKKIVKYVCWTDSINMP